MNLSNQAQILPDEIRSLLEGERVETAAQINCVQVGKIVGVNLAAGTVTVQIVIARAVFNNPPDGTAVNPDPQTYPYPVLFNVPLFTPFGGSGVLTFPVAIGDTCILLFNDRDLDPWLTDGTYGELPNDLTRVHSLSDGMALVGVRPLTSPIANWDTTRVQLRNGTSMVSVGEYIRLANATMSMKTLMDNFITTLKALTTSSGTPLSAASIAALATIQTQSDSLFET